MATIDPTSLANQLAIAYTQPTQSMLDAKQKASQATTAALDKLQSALQAFTSAMSSMSVKKSVLQYSAVFSNTDIGTATTSATAQPGTYSLFVEQLASAHQVSFANLPTVPVGSSGTLTVQQINGSSFTVDFTGADSDNDGTLTQTEIARAINQAAGNEGKVNAMLVTVGGQTQLVLASATTGEGGQISLDTSGLAAGQLKDSLDNGTELTQARDAIVWLGGQGTGIQMKQASNTYTSIQGVSMTFTKAMNMGDPPVTLTVAADDNGTASNVQSFVDAYNALDKALDELTANGGEGKEKAALASDSGVRALRDKLGTLLRQQIDGLRLLDFGISAGRHGTLSLDQGKLQKKLAAQPDALDTLFGSNNLGASSGILGSLDGYVKTWVNSTNGQIKLRKDSAQKLQSDLATRQTRLDAQFSSAYQRYLRQFTQLQTLQSQMEQNTGMFDLLGT